MRFSFPATFGLVRCEDKLGSALNKYQLITSSTLFPPIGLSAQPPSPLYIRLIQTEIPDPRIAALLLGPAVPFHPIRCFRCVLSLANIPINLH